MIADEEQRQDLLRRYEGFLFDLDGRFCLILV